MKKNILVLAAVLIASVFLAMSCKPFHSQPVVALDVQTLLETIPRLRLNLPASLLADSQVSNRAITVLDGSTASHVKSEFWTKLQDSSGILLVDYADLVNQTIRSYAMDYNVPLGTITDMQLPDAIAEGLLGTLFGYYSASESSMAFLADVSPGGDASLYAKIIIVAREEQFSQTNVLSMRTDFSGVDSGSALDTYLLLTTIQADGDTTSEPYESYLYCGLDPASGTMVSVMMYGEDETVVKGKEGPGSSVTIVSMNRNYLGAPDFVQVLYGDASAGGSEYITQFSDEDNSYYQSEIYDGSGNLVRRRRRNDDVSVSVTSFGKTFGVNTWYPLAEQFPLAQSYSGWELVNDPDSEKIYYLNHEVAETPKVFDDDDVDLSAMLGMMTLFVGDGDSGQTVNILSSVEYDPLPYFSMPAKDELSRIDTALATATTGIFELSADEYSAELAITASDPTLGKFD